MYQNLKSWPDFHHRINLVYHGIIALSLFPFAFIFLNIDSGVSKTPLIASTWLAVLHIGTIPLITGSFFMVWRHSEKNLSRINENSDIRKRIISYFKFQTRRYLLLELGAIICLLGMWLSLNYLYIILYLIALVQFSLLRPSQDKVIRDLKFTKEERERLKQEVL